MVPIIFKCPVRSQRIVFGAAIAPTRTIRVIICDNGAWLKCTTWGIHSPKFNSIVETLTIHSMYTASKYSEAEIRSHTKAGWISNDT